MSTGVTLIARPAVHVLSALASSVFYTALYIASALPVSQALLQLSTASGAASGV